MLLFSLVVVLLIEQIRPLPDALRAHSPLAALADALEAGFDTGETRYGALAWLIGAGGLTLLVLAFYWLLRWVHPLLGWSWTVLVLYCTLGFRRFSHHYSDIQLALRMDDVVHARALLAQWSGRPADALEAPQIARLSIEQALLCAHRHVFAVVVCFVLLPGPSGAVLYRVAAYLAERWAARAGGERRFGEFAKRAFALIDWLPSRLTAAGFSIVGNFEDAVYCWRTQAGNWPDARFGRGAGIVLASGAGALGVRLGGAVGDAQLDAGRGEVGCGDEANVDFMQGTVALLWRALCLWLMMLLLLSLSRLFA